MKKTDEVGGRAYSCMAINYFMRDNAIGPEFEIKVYGSKYMWKGFIIQYSKHTKVLYVSV